MEEKYQTIKELIMDSNPFVYQSETLKELPAALSNFQANMKGKITRSDDGQFKYARLDTILAAIIEPLKEHKLAVSQHSFPYNGIIYMKTVLLHNNSEFIASISILYSEAAALKECSSMQEEGNKQKKLGAIHTYQGRYALKHLLGLAIEDEDFDDKKKESEEDSNYNEKESKSTQKSVWTYKQLEGCITKQQSNELYAQLNKLEQPVRKAILEKYGAKTTNMIRVEDLTSVYEDIHSLIKS